MSSGLNKVQCIGNLGRDPEVRFTPGGQAVCNFSVAVTESWKDKGGQKQERTEWVRVVVWGKLAELCGEHLKKGRQCYVEGKLQTREWADKESRKQFTTEVIASSVLFLGGAGERSSAGRASVDQPRGQVESPPDDGGTQDDIPFWTLSHVEWSLQSQCGVGTTLPTSRPHGSRDGCRSAALSMARSLC